MSRDVLLACLTLALLLNLALLGQAANLYYRRGRPASRTTREHTGAPVREQAVMTLPHARPAVAEIESTASNGSDHLLVPVAIDRPEPAEPRSLPPPAAEPIRRVTAEPQPAKPEPAKTEPAPARPPTVAAAADEATNGTLPDPAAATTKRGSKRPARGRRFVLPPLDEDQARSVRAIEAFLDGPPPPSGTAPGRPPRRRHRARRAAGSPVPRTTMVVWLHGFSDLDRTVGTTRAANVSAAFVDALRRAARATDEVREMSSGRVRVVVETDDAGATAFVERARKGVQPWLELLAVPLKVESGARESSEIVPFAASRRAASDHPGFGRS
jgi:hypothetical protein